MKRTRFTYALLLLFVIGIVILFAKPLWSQNDESEKEGKTHESTTEDSRYPGIDIKTEMIEKENYQMAIHYPDLQSNALNDPINAYVTQAKQTFLKEIENNLEYLQQKDRSGTFNLTFDIYEIAEAMYSIVFTEESYVAGANGRQSSKVLWLIKWKKRLLILKKY